MHIVISLGTPSYIDILHIYSGEMERMNMVKYNNDYYNFHTLFHHKNVCACVCMYVAIDICMYVLRMYVYINFL